MKKPTQPAVQKVAKGTIARCAKMGNDYTASLYAQLTKGSARALRKALRSLGHADLAALPRAKA